jgi:hypothetical protein
MDRKVLYVQSELAFTDEGEKNEIPFWQKPTLVLIKKGPLAKVCSFLRCKLAAFNVILVVYRLKSHYVLTLIV